MGLSGRTHSRGVESGREVCRVWKNPQVRGTYIGGFPEPERAIRGAPEALRVLRRSLVARKVLLRGMSCRRGRVHQRRRD